MAPVKKFGIMGLFTTGTVYAVVGGHSQITKNVYKYGQGIDETGLAICGMVGFVPAFILFTIPSRTREEPFDITHGHQKQQEVGSGREASEQASNIYKTSSVVSKQRLDKI
ncbi:hypothetical protein P171DRAFT_447818 [Karstenula rhodostoma CBS 690.94]|uniref:Uncharacterized protein n=1 Tax=Karstenula rhodostoma CBS 690.94 TaxID=1392251 RepID=A0A9P4U679_9PLEO|nr:hypothetical protein P171DRAFT_447818 [Karstenula rhodostoma CBS 690.94]